MPVLALQSHPCITPPALGESSHTKPHMTTNAPATTARDGARRSAKPRRIHPHVEHILTHLKRTKNGQITISKPEEVYLGHACDSFLWELIGLRLEGNPNPILGCMYFRRHDFPGKAHARESLATYLSNPPSEITSSSLAVPMGAVPVLLPRTTETVPGFLKNVAMGNLPQPVYLDPTRIEFAWDFRTYNPYGIEALKHRADALRERIIRTGRGHIIRGMSHELVQPLGGSRRFVAIKDPQQLVPEGRIGLPALAVNRSFVAISADITDQTTRLAAANWFPFSMNSASRKHVLLG